MGHSKAILKMLGEWIKKVPKWICLCLLVLIISFLILPYNTANAYSYGEKKEVSAEVEMGVTISPISPLKQQIKLTQPSPVIPGGRGYMVPQSVIVKNSLGNPVQGVAVKFEVSSDNYVDATMRGLDSKTITVITDANGVATAANTFVDYRGEGFRIYSKYNSMVRSLKVKASVEGIDAITFDVEVGTNGSRIEDNTPPNITATAKDSTGADYIAGTWTKNSVTVHYTAIDSIAGIKSCTPDQVFNNEGANQIASGKAIDNAAKSENDTNHISNITFGPINIDKSTPTTTAIVKQPNGDVWNRGPVKIAFSANDSISGVEAIYYKIGDSEPVKTDGNTALADITTEGIINVSYWAVDKAGNSETAKSLTVKVDNSAPSLDYTISPDKNENGWISSDVSLTLNAADKNSGIKEIHYKIGEAGVEQIVKKQETMFFIKDEGIIPVTFWAIDNVGNVSDKQKIEVKIDKTAPLITVPSDIYGVEATGINTPIDIGKATVLDASEVILTNDAPAKGFPIGTTKVTWTARDQVGRTASVIQTVTVRDTIKPVLSIPGDKVYEAEGYKTYIKLQEATAKDIFPVNVTSNAPIDGFSIGTTKITWTAKDANGNETTGTQNITVVDNTKPELKLPADLKVEATGKNTVVNIGQATATDIFKVTLTNNAPETYPVGVTKVAWKAVDENGNVTIAEQTIIVEDTKKPILNIPKDIEVEADAVRTVVKIGEATAIDEFRVYVTNDAPKDFKVGTTIVTWEAIDENGNKTSAQQKIIVKDTTKPEIIVPKDIIYEAEGIRTNINIGNAKAKDIFNVNISNNAPKDYMIGKTIVTWKATDENGNVSEATQVITVVDTTKPVLSVPKDVTMEATGVRTPVEIGNATATDIFKVDVTNNAQVDYGIGTTQVTWKAVDENGNVTTAVQNIIIVDTTKPVLSVPKDITMEATGVRTPVEIGEAKATDIFKVDVTSNAPADYGIGTTQVTWKAVDENGNVTTAVQNITIVDTTKPVLTVPKDITKEATGVRTPVEIGNATATDIFKVTIKNNAPADYPIGTTKVTWTATDENGNVTELVQNITIEDTRKPELIVPKNITKEATGIRTPVEIGEAITKDIFKVTIKNNALVDYPIGVTEVTWIATDENGNTTTGVQKVTIVDTTKPDLIVPKDIIQEATGVKTPVVLGSSTATDIFKVKISNNALDYYPIGTTKVIWKAIDENGNETEMVQNVTIVDTTKPVLSIPKDIIKEATGVKTPVVLGSSTATDIFKVKISNNALDYYPIGTTKVIWKAIDENGNETEMVQNVTIVDTTKPVLSIPKDITKEATGVRTPVEIGNATATDIFKVDITNNAPTDYGIGTTQVTWKAIDENGNETEMVQNVTIVDTTKPVLSIPKDITKEATGVRTPVEIGNATATDIFKVDITNNAPTDYGIGTTQVTWKAIDENGNETEMVQNVTIVDTTKPVLTVPKDITKEATGVRTPVEIGNATATDIFKVDVTNNAPADYGIGTTKVTWKAIDENGNVITGIQNITIVDTTKPVLTVPKDITKEATGVRTPVEMGNATATDIFKVDVTNNAPADYGIGTTKVTWKAIDENGNVITGIQNITIVDTTKPVVTVPKDITKEATGVRTPVEIGNATATDIFKVDVTNNAPADYGIGTTKVIWKAIDENGNETELVQNITIVDTTKPVLTVPNDITKEATGVRTPVEIGEAKATDIFKVDVTNNSPADYGIGTTKVTWKAIDENGNETEMVQNVTIVDTTKPVLSIPNDITKEATGVRTPVEIGEAKATDIFKVDVTNNSPADYGIGTTKVTWKAIDENGNETEMVQNVTIVDTTKPVLSIPKDITKEATGVRTPVEIGEAKATDIFKVDVTNNAPADYGIGTTKVTWKAIDENGNVITGIQNITIVDTTKPVLTVPNDITMEATGVKTPVSIGNASATDIFKVVITNNAPAEYPIGTTKVMWTAIDENGNRTIGIQNITIEHKKNPELNVPKDIVKEATAVRTPVEIGEATSKCILNVAITNDAPVDDYPIGLTKVTWKAVDELGNTTIKVQNVTIVDTTKPILRVPSDIRVFANGARTKVDIGNATATDVFKVRVTNNAPADYPIGTTMVTWTAKDANGNVATAVQRITVMEELKLKAYNRTRNDVSKVIDPCIMLENVSQNTINLSDISIRYYYTADTEENQNFWCDYAQLDGYQGSYSVTSCVRERLVKGNGSNYYLEISFAQNTGTLNPGEKVSIYNVIQKSEWYTSYIQSNDYSFNPSATNFVDNNKITVYLSDVLVSGIEP